MGLSCAKVSVGKYVWWLVAVSETKMLREELFTSLSLLSLFLTCNHFQAVLM